MNRGALIRCQHQKVTSRCTGNVSSSWLPFRQIRSVSAASDNPHAANNVMNSPPLRSSTWTTQRRFDQREGETPAEPKNADKTRLGGSLALPNDTFADSLSKRDVVLGGGPERPRHSRDRQHLKATRHSRRCNDKRRPRQCRGIVAVLPKTQSQRLALTAPF
jgi:hypothetical protein